MANWLPGWRYRIEITLPDYAGKIGGSVTWFPADVFLTATQAEEVFAELTTDAEYKKIQFTQTDGTSLLYGHKKLFDVGAELGIFTVSADGWTIDGNTSIFLYYDKDHADNNTYIGVTNTSACEAVYDGNFKGVYPMDDGADTSHIYDATSNNNDGTKKDPNEPIEIAGKVGQAQSFDGNNDYIDCGDITGLDGSTKITFSAIVKTDSNSNQGIISKAVNASRSFLFELVQGGSFPRVMGKVFNGSTSNINFVSVIADNDVIPLNTWTYIVVHLDLTNNANSFIYVNGVIVNSTVATNGTPPTEVINVASVLEIGRLWVATEHFSGLIDEPNISNDVRSAAWIRGSYNSAWDDLFTYGSEELRLILKVLSGTFGLTGTVGILSKITLAGVFSSTGVVSSALRYAQSLSGVFGLTGTVSSIRKSFQSLAGVFGLTGTITKLPKITLAGVFTLTGTITKLPKITLAGVFTLTGAVIKLPKIALSGVFGLTGTMVKLPKIILAGVLSPTGIVGRFTKIILSGAFGLTGIVGRLTKISLSGVFSLTGSIYFKNLYTKIVKGLSTYTKIAKDISTYLKRYK